ncbi:tyrosine-type recombinase/integrase [Nocardioides okcheonensis]|uniref:hypothetical protein n=1 Tax=Nocardioides okcheonensis TaxID=2894081 RepID=UPI001E2B525F|nr:hypothetical protein [Nocardioides okcheonensis]UFN46503.1 hypothetical protein LN652_09970 [Nocardioides okcheonensis]
MIAETRVRDDDGRLRQVRISARSRAQATKILKERLLNRPRFGAASLLTPQSSFGDLVDAWLAQLEAQTLAENTKQNYRDQVRLHVLPAFEHFSLAEGTSARIGDI